MPVCCATCKASLPGREVPGYCLRQRGSANRPAEMPEPQPEVVSGRSVRGAPRDTGDPAPSAELRGLVADDGTPEALSSVAAPDGASAALSPQRKMAVAVRQPLPVASAPDSGAASSSSSCTSSQPLPPPAVQPDVPSPSPRRRVKRSVLRTDGGFDQWALVEGGILLADGRTLSVADVWSLISENIKGQVSRDTFDTTFRHASLAGWDGDSLVLEFPSAQMIEAVRDRFQYAVERAVTFVLGRSLPVQLVEKERN